MHALSSSPSAPRALAARTARPRAQRRASLAASAAAGASRADYRPVPFPKSYKEMVAQAQDALLAAKADGLLLQEIQFPSGGLDSVAGDQEGNVENNLTVRYLRQIADAFKRDGSQAHVRVFFPVKSTCAALRCLCTRAH